MSHLLLGRARESPAPKLLLVIPSKLDCLKLAKFFRLELKVYCVRLGTKCLDRMDVQQLYPIYWTLRADGKLKIHIYFYEKVLNTKCFILNNHNLFDKTPNTFQLHADLLK